MKDDRFRDTELSVLGDDSPWNSHISKHLDSILKNRDITLPTKVCIVKAMVFPVVIYGYESWTIKKKKKKLSAKESKLLNCGVGEDT